MVFPLRRTVQLPDIPYSGGRTDIPHSGSANIAEVPYGMVAFAPYNSLTYRILVAVRTLRKSHAVWRPLLLVTYHTLIERHITP